MRREGGSPLLHDLPIKPGANQNQTIKDLKFMLSDRRVEFLQKL